VSRYRLERYGSKFFLMRGEFGMADLHFDGQHWRVTGYGQRNPVGLFPTLRSGLKAAIKSARHTFEQAGLYDR
jgi:hypothetical protein